MERPPKMSLSNRLAIVTGGGSGIGKAVCHALAKDGATVVVADINLDAARATVAELKGLVIPTVTFYSARVRICNHKTDLI